MDSAQYKATLAELGLTQKAFATFLDQHPVTGKKWARNGPPPPVAKWLRYLKARHMTPADINAAIDEVAA
jgi:hypothetical protein